MKDDAALLVRYARDGDDAAFAEVVRRHMGWTYAVALRRVAGDRPLAEEVVQTVFGALAREPRSFDEQRQLGPWLHRSVVFASAKAVRTEVRRRRKMEHLMSREAIGSGEDEGMDREAAAAALDEILDRAKASERAVLTLHFFENRSLDEVAEQLRITQEAARKRVERALGRLRERLARRGIRSSAAAVAALLASDGLSAAPSGLAAAVSAEAVKTAAGLGPLGAVTHLMNAKITTVTLAAVVCLGGGLALRENHRARIAEAASARDERALEEMLQQAARPASAAAPKVAGVPHGHLPSQAGVEDATAQRNLTIVKDRESRILSDDAYRKALFSMVRTNHALYGATWFKQKGLSPQQIEAVLDAQDKQTSQAYDLKAAAKELGVSADSEAFIGAMRQITAAYATDLASAVGPENAAEFQRQEQSSSAGDAVQQLTQAMYDTTAPVSASQMSQLKAAIIGHDSTAGSDEDWHLNGIDWDATNREAAKILSDQQLETWNSVVAELKWRAENLRAINGYKW